MRHRPVGPWFLCFVSMFSIALSVVLHVAPDRAFAGRGTFDVETVQVDGTPQDVAFVDLYMEVNDANPGRTLTQAELSNIESGIDTANKILWDATEGQFLLEHVYVLSNRRTNDRFADISYSPTNGRSSVVGGSGVVGLGRRATQVSYADSPADFHASEFAHELVHYILGCGDGYKTLRENCGGTVIDYNNGMGACIASSDETPQSTTLTQHSDGITPGASVGSELCTAANHDPKRGCSSPNGYTYKTNQTALTETSATPSGKSCWESVEKLWSHASAPSGAPKPEMPSGYQSVDLVDLQNATSNVALVLDRSGSMSWAAESDGGEVCGNSEDDDYDGTIDESDCSVARMNFLKAGARAFLRIAEYEDDFKVALLSYASSPDMEQPFREIDSGNVTTYENAVNSLSPGGTTAIGDALVYTKDAFVAEGFGEVVPKWGVLFSDGKHNHGSATPQDGIQALQDKNISMNTVATGAAAQQSTLLDIQRDTQAMVTMMLETNYDMVANFALLMAKHLKAQLYVPHLRWRLQRGEPNDHHIAPDDWFAEAHEQSDPYKSGGSGRVSVPVGVVEGTSRLTVVAGATIDDMQGYGIEARFVGPSGQTLDTTQSSSQLSVHRDPYFDIFRLSRPQPGSWEVELRPASGSGEFQSGTLTIFGQARQMQSGHDIRPRIVPNKNDTADVDGFSNYVSRLRDYGSLSAVSVEGPTGQNVGYSVAEDRHGTLESTIHSLNYEGAHRVEILFETGEHTGIPSGEPITPGTPRSVDVPMTIYGEIGSLFLNNGDDPGLNFRDEQEYFAP